MSANISILLPKPLIYLRHSCEPPSKSTKMAISRVRVMTISRLVTYNFSVCDRASHTNDLDVAWLNLDDVSGPKLILWLRSHLLV